MIPSATSAAFRVTNVALTDVATYTVEVTSSGACANTVTSSNAIVSVDSPALITVQPTSSQALCVGSSLTLSVTVTGSGTLSYQWKKDGVNIPSGTSASFSIASVVVGDGATYTVDVTSSGACANTITSSDAIVSVDSPALITVQPTASQTLCVGTALNLSVTASGTGLSYQWKKDGVNIPSATSAAFGIANVALTDVATYTVEVTSSGACANTVTSSNAIVSVDSPALITVQPTSSQALCVGSSLTLSVTATGSGPLSYQWKKDGVNILSATSASFSIASVVVGDGASYTVDVTSSGACANTITSS